MTQSPEMETLDQLLGGDMPLAVVRKLFPTAGSFVRGVTGLLSSGDVRLVDCDGQELPRWRWREVLDETQAISTGLRLGLTEQRRAENWLTVGSPLCLRGSVCIIRHRNPLGGAGRFTQSHEGTEGG